MRLRWLDNSVPDQLGGATALRCVPHPRRTATPSWDSGSGPGPPGPGVDYTDVSGSAADRSGKNPRKILAQNFAAFFQRKTGTGLPILEKVG
jgi:hypothetical protein